MFSGDINNFQVICHLFHTETEIDRQFYIFFKVYELRFWSNILDLKNRVVVLSDRTSREPDKTVVSIIRDA